MQCKLEVVKLIVAVSRIQYEYIQVVLKFESANWHASGLRIEAQEAAVTQRTMLRHSDNCY